jgi:hypothetical protein
LAETQVWMWLLKTNKGDFFITALKWNQQEAIENIKDVFSRLGIEIQSWVPRKRSTGLDDVQCTIYKSEKDELGYQFLAGKKIWQACGRGAEFEAELIRHRMEARV